MNGLVDMPGKISHDHLDSLLELVREFKERCGQIPALWKADVNAAFRRIPLRPDHAWAAGMPVVLFQLAVSFSLCVAVPSGSTYMHDGQAWCSFHAAMPFGATSSVWAWDRVGAFLAMLARTILFIPVLRYVDDYFSVEWYSRLARAPHWFLTSRILVGRQETAEHAMHCFARLIRLLLGDTSISEKKLEWGRVLVVLGMRVRPMAEGQL